MTKNKRLKQGIDTYNEMLMNAASYSGNKVPKQKIFSASMLGNEVLENYLRYMHGGKEQTRFEANTAGSLFQLGVDSAAELWNREQREDQYTNAKRIKYTLSNGWIVSGEMDQIDNVNGIIFDNKLTTATSILKVRSEGTRNGYNLQQSVYRMLLRKDEEAKGLTEFTDYQAVLPMVDKKFSHVNPGNLHTMNYEVLELSSIEDIEQMLLDATNLLDEYIAIEEEPPQCLNLFWNYDKKTQNRKPLKCIFYCDQNTHCSHYSDRFAMKNLLEGL